MKPAVAVILLIIIIIICSYLVVYVQFTSNIFTGA